jgi:ketosteroid isomerase-like protein
MMRTDVTAASDVATLEQMNREYLRAVETSDAGWFDRTLSADFRCSLPDGSIMDRARFLDRAAKPVDLSNLEAHEVEVRFFGDTAIVHARTTFLTNDGRAGSGRYTDVWVRDRDRWVAVAAHITRKVE